KEDKSGWSEFLKHLKERGLKGIRLITSDACIGLAESAAEFFPDAAWQRCVVHWYRNIFSHVPSTKVRVPHSAQEFYRTWRKLTTPDPYPGMISAAERSFYSRCAASMAAEAGCVVDLGYWMGATTAALAEGFSVRRRRTFAANAVRLQLHALAYNLGNF